MKLSVTRARRQLLKVLDAARHGTNVTITRRGKPAVSLETDGSIMVREEPGSEQARAAARAILVGMRQRAGGETAREALAAVREGLG